MLCEEKEFCDLILAINKYYPSYSWAQRGHQVEPRPEPESLH